MPRREGWELGPRVRTYVAPKAKKCKMHLKPKPESRNWDMEVGGWGVGEIGEGNKEDTYHR